MAQLCGGQTDEGVVALRPASVGPGMALHTIFTFANQRMPFLLLQI